MKETDDFLNSSEVSEAFRGCEVVFHLASTTLPKSSNETPAYDMDINIIAYIQMLDAAK